MAKRMKWKGIIRELRDNGVKVRTVKGWKTRGYTSFNPQGSCEHHTASNKDSGNAPSLDICVNGRAGIPGPLCNGLFGRDGTLYLIARGKANHAGLGGPLWWCPENYANTYTFGFEIENNGIGEPYAPELKKAVAVTTAIFNRRCLPWWKARRKRRTFGHKEWAPNRKIDPYGINMRKFRQRVVRIIRRLRRKSNA